MKVPTEDYRLGQRTGLAVCGFVNGGCEEVYSGLRRKDFERAKALAKLFVVVAVSGQ